MRMTTVSRALGSKLYLFSVTYKEDMIILQMKTL